MSYKQKYNERKKLHLQKNRENVSIIKNKDMNNIKSFLNYIYPFLINIIVTWICMWVTYVIIAFLAFFMLLKQNWRWPIDSNMAYILIAEIVGSIIVIIFILNRNSTLYKEYYSKSPQHIMHSKSIYYFQFIFILIVSVTLISLLWYIVLG